MSTAQSQSKQSKLQIQGLKSETVPLFNLRNGFTPGKNNKSIIDKYSISWIDVIIITFVCTINQLIYKSWFVFEAFIDVEYHITFVFLSWGLTIFQTAAFPTIFLVPYLTAYKCNYLCLIINIFAMMCTILNSILSGSIFNIFIVSFIRSFMSQTFWTLGNSIVFHFMQEIEGEKKWRKNTATTIFMGSWTFSTPLFLVIGPLIDNYGFKSTMIMAACVNIAATILLFYRTPAISLNDFIEIEHVLQNNMDDHDKKADDKCHKKLFSDIKILFGDIFVVFILLNTLACVCNWGMYYGSFGFWLQELFHVNAFKLGIYVTLCEACAETISLCAIPILSKYVSNSQLCIIGGLCETSSVVILNCILWNNAEILNTYILSIDIEWMRIGIVLLVIFLFYMGHEFLYISLMVSIDIVPKKTHNTAVALYGCSDFTGAVIGQTFVTYVFSKHGMVSMAPIMLMVEFVSVACIISMNIIRCRRKKVELENVLSGNINDVQKEIKNSNNLSNEQESFSFNDHKVLDTEKNSLLPHNSNDNLNM